MVGEQGVHREVAKRLIVKLNLKKNVGDHVCKICKKCLPSGKALGDHMRTHHEDWEGGNQHKVVVHGGGGEREVAVHHLSSTTCKLCYREFPSMKALFGHMRSHPKRTWRGINPPSYPLPPPPPPPPTPPHPPLKNSSSSALSDTTLAQTHSGEEHEFRSGNGSTLKNWLVTARRARRDSSPMSLFDSAVEALCMLSRGENLNKKGEGEDDDDYSGYSIGALYESGNEPDDKSKINKFEIGPCRIESNQNQMSRKKVTKKRKLCTLSGNGMYKCSTCNKGFHSHRALGGHMAGHKRNKNHCYASDEERQLVIEQAAAAVAEETGAEMAATMPVVAVHRCEICGMTFPSGQVLGGHKRRHWVKPAEVASSSRSASLAEKKAAGASGRVMEFDLNEPPPME